MKEIFAEEINDEYIELKKETMKNDISYGEESFIYKLYKIDSILNSNVDFVNKVIKIRNNKRTLKQYDEQYIDFIKVYNRIVNNFAMRIRNITDKHMSKPSFILDLSIYRDDISFKILNEIVREKGNLQLLGMKLSIIFKENKRYADELYAMYYNYDNSINLIRDELIEGIYSKRLK